MEEAAELANYLPLSFMSRKDGIPLGQDPQRATSSPQANGNPR